MTPPVVPPPAAVAPVAVAPTAVAPAATGPAVAGPPVLLAQASGAQATGGPSGAVPQPPATAAPQAGRIELPPPPPGQPAGLQVLPGMRLVLPDAAFLPPQAKYLVQGDDLVIETAMGGVLTLEGFFAAPGATISVAGRPPVANTFLFESAVVDAAGQTVIPTAPPSGPQPATPGNGSFSPYAPGDIGTGIDATGPLGPTELARAVAFDIRDVGGDVTGAQENGPPLPNTPPTVELSGRVTATVTADPIGFNPPGNAPTPPTGEGGPIDEDDVNGLPPGFVTLDTDRVIEIVFRGETAGLVNSLGGFRIGPDGRIAEAGILFPRVNDQSDPPGFPGTPGPLTPGDSVSLGLVPAGTTLGFFIVQNGGKLPGVDLATGRIEIRDPATGGPADLDTLTGPPSVVHIAPNGVETVLPVVFFANDPDPSTPGSNPLNPFGLAYVISGFDPVSGEVVAQFEDLAGPRGAQVPVPGTRDPADPTRPWVGTADRDFNDVEFSARFSEASLGDALFLGDQKGLIQAALDDADGDALRAASVRIAGGGQAGDGLALASTADLNGDGIVDGTSIRLEQVSPTELAFNGVDSLEAYEQALGAVVFRSTSGDIQPGTRQIEVTVTDERGATSDPAVVALEIRDNGIVLGDGGETFLGTDLPDAVFGGRGDDTLFGLGGNDLLIGGGGSDTLSGGDGDDVLIGLGGRDVLVGGRGADRFVHTALSDGRDDVQDFNTAEGDRLDLEKLFRGTAFDPDGPDADRFLRFVVGDLDGSGGTNDVAVEVDRDGAGTAYGFSAVFHLLNQVDPSLITIETATTFGERV